jgi:2,4-dienoyl-CoA reductase-like NADH-dependent reductase (Old Yellow Enzyme family)/NADPH-dependent 2,4-dienoyl-CoA reductase/sulfur reductase-like enzyme
MSEVRQRASDPFWLANRLALRNRLVGTAHGAGLVIDGLAQPADAEYWRRRAAGGAAMLIVGGTVTAPESTWRRRIVSEAWREEAVPGMSLRAEAIRSEGAVAGCQLVHLGRETTGAEMWFAPVAPSAIRSPREPTRPRALSDDEIDGVVEGFRVSAVHAAQAGFQVLELHAAHGYLLAQFLSPMSNRRPDAGSPADRSRIVARIVRAIRAAAPELVIGIRLSIEGGAEAGQTLDGLCELLPHCAPLVDYVNVTVGVRTTYVKDMATEEPPLLEAIERLRSVVEQPLLISQAFRHGHQVERALAAGADLVGMARPLIADPDFPSKLLSGREAQIRPCVSCNEDCRAFDPQLLCSVNPELAPRGMERRPAAPLVVQHGAADADVATCAVAIVGAGPAGLECATALAGGCDVVLFDERAAIGGQLATAAAAPHRHGWQALLNFYGSGLAATADIDVRLGVRATASDLDGFAHVVIASGSEEVLPPLTGIERAVSASDAIRRGAAAVPRGSSLLIVDDGFGSWWGASAVELGISAGAKLITVITPAAGFFSALPAEGRVQLLARLRGAPLVLRPATGLDAITEGGAELRNLMSDDTETIDADTVIVVGERRPRDWSSLVPPSATVHVIGDALVPRRVGPAISEGRAAAEAIRRALSRDEVTAPA